MPSLLSGALSERYDVRLVHGVLGMEHGLSTRCCQGDGGTFKPKENTELGLADGFPHMLGY